MKPVRITSCSAAVGRSRRRRHERPTGSRRRRRSVRPRAREGLVAVAADDLRLFSISSSETMSASRGVDRVDDLRLLAAKFTRSRRHAGRCPVQLFTAIGMPSRSLKDVQCRVRRVVDTQGGEVVEDVEGRELEVAADVLRRWPGGPARMRLTGGRLPDDLGLRLDLPAEPVVEDDRLREGHSRADPDLVGRGEPRERASPGRARCWRCSSTWCWSRRRGSAGGRCCRPRAAMPAWPGRR